MNGHGRIERHRAGTVLYHRGDAPDALHVVLSGRLEVVGLDLPPMEAGDLVGELGVLLNQPRSATVRVIEDAELITIDRDNLDNAMAAEPELAELVRGLARRVHQRSPVVVQQTRFTAVSGDRAQEIADLVHDATGERCRFVAPDAEADGLEHALVAPTDPRAQLTVAFGAAPRGLPGPVIRCGGDERGLRRAARWASGRAVGLALSSGGSKTVAHLGVIQALREANVPIDAVAGTSGGALVAVGYGFELGDDQAMRNVRDLAELTRLRRFDVNPVPRTSLARGKKLHALFESWFPHRVLEDAVVPVFAVAADIHSGEEVVIKQGPAADAMRASMSLPVYLEPWRINGRMLVDGAIVTPVPVHVLREAGVGHVIASSVAGQERTAQQAARKAPSIPRTVLRLVDSMERALLKTQEPHADVLIRPPLWIESTFNFSRAQEVRAAGVEAGRAALPDLKTLLARLGALG